MWRPYKNAGLGTPRDLTHQADRLLDHCGGNVEMGAGANPAIHHRKQHATLTQALDHVIAGDAGAIGVEENKVGFGWLHLDAGDSL